MNLGKVIGKVWATQKIPGLTGQRMLFVQPMTFSMEFAGNPIIALDTVDAGEGDMVVYVSSFEATIPFQPELVPTDATIVGVIDRIDLDPAAR
jgi:bacterial microcompartment shell vertex protein